MPVPELSSADRRNLRAQGQTLAAAVQVGHHGITPMLLKELSTALDRDGLVKVRIAEPDRKARQALVDKLAGQSVAALVGTVGRTALLYRPTPDS